MCHPAPFARTSTSPIPNLESPNGRDAAFIVFNTSINTCSSCSALRDRAGIGMFHIMLFNNFLADADLYNLWLSSLIMIHRFIRDDMPRPSSSISRVHVEPDGLLRVRSSHGAARRTPQQGAPRRNANDCSDGLIRLFHAGGRRAAQMPA